MIFFPAGLKQNLLAQSLTSTPRKWSSTMQTDHIQRFRFHGIRKLNWAERPHGLDYLTHMAEAGLDDWIEPGPLMIVIGPNGGGKTTVIDLLRGLTDATIWPTLPRENYGGEDFSGFDIEGGAFTLSARFSKYTLDAAATFDFFTAFAMADGSLGPSYFEALLPKYREAGTSFAELEAFLSAAIPLEIRYRPATGAHPADELDDSALVDLLNELSPQFRSVMANPQVLPFRLFEGAAKGPGRIGVMFKEDVGQHIFVHRTMLPAGWLQLASVLAFLRGCPSGALILLDEPDRHLHPSLQRTMLEVLAREGSAIRAQIVVATHSSVLINPELCRNNSASVISVSRGRCEILTPSRQILDDLGVTSGDLAQANGVIWVEGPSDRIYIKAWIDALRRHTGKPPLIERVHYTFVSYGGALLKHLTLSDDAPDKMSVRSINRNAFVIIDGDMTLNPDARLSAEKQRILEEARRISADTAIWITERYTIEAYLPSAWQLTEHHIEHDADGRIRVKGISKIELAAAFAGTGFDWDALEPANSDLGSRITALVAAIEAWQSPNEAIEPNYLPPFLIDG